jgi:hypothetical protein
LTSATRLRTVCATGNHLETLYGQVVFSAGSEEYCWEDVVLAAELWGDWTCVRDRLHQGLACLRASEERESGPEEQEVESAATEFRYARDLVSAQEMEDWLTRWDLTAEGWMDYVRWSLLRRTWSDQVADLVSEYPPEDGDVDRFLRVEAVCSGDLERFAGELAGRVAVGERENGGEPDDAEVSEVLRHFPAHLTERGLAGIAPAACRAKMERLARVEVSFRRFREEGATPGRIAALIRSRRIDWTRFNLDSIAFPEEQMAREAALCVREDGRDLCEVAADARREVRRSTMYIEEMDATVRDDFLGAQKGELLGPFESRGEFVLYQILDKTLPSPDDAALTVRAREAVLRLQMDREINDRVKWARPA